MSTGPSIRERSFGFAVATMPDCDEALWHAPIGVFVSTLAGRFTFANPTMARMYGYATPEEFLNGITDIPSQIYFDPADRDYFVDMLAKCGEIVNHECRQVRRDGTMFWVARNARAVRDENGTITHYQGFSSDISEQKRAETALAEQHQLLNSLARLVPGVIYQFRLYPDGRSAFPYASPGMQQIYEVAPEEVRQDATSVYDRLHPEDRTRVTEAILASAETLNIFSSEFRVVLPRQGLCWRWSQAHPQRLDDGSTLWHGVILDITERRRIEEERTQLQEQLTQAQKMESVGRLAGGVAHDFNNMLGVILGYTELLLLETARDPAIRSSLEAIRDAAQRSAKLTQQLLAFARKQAVAPRVLDLNRTINDMLAMVRRLIGEDIALRWHPGEDLWPVKIDPSQIDQIMANLCVNARDAISDTGSIGIETRNVRVDHTFPGHQPDALLGDYVLLAVSDNGCGMDDKTLANLFEPFFTTKETGKGTGLGLAMVFGIVKQNGGFIDVVSEPGRGTTFAIYLPSHASEKAKERLEGRIEEISAGTETILLVEDEVTILNMTTLMLKRLGYRVLPAATPGEAIRLAGEHQGKIDLLLTDVVMPETNGRELAKKLLAVYPELKRLFMSGYTAEVIAQHGVLDEGVHFIHKPFHLKELAAKIREALGYGETFV